jgi:putative membrane protein
VSRPGDGSVDAAPPDTTPHSAPAADVPWRRLDPRMLVVGPLTNLAQLLPVVVIVLLTGRSGGLDQVAYAVGGAAVVVLAGVVRWRTTRYRITDERVELHTGLLRRQRRSVPRDRIRTVDLTASLVHRVFGLSVVQVRSATGGGSTADRSGRMDLDAVSTAEAERLRRLLLDRATVTPATPAPATELARLRWSWLRFAPLTVSSLAGVGAVVGAAFNLFSELGVDPRDVGAVSDTARALRTAPLAVGVAVVAAALLAVAAVGSIVLFAERWYAYRLTREPDGSLRVLRGLLTRRSLSVSAERLRGAEVVEPLLLRAGRGAQVRALSTGLREGGSGALGPPAPRAEAHRLAAVALQAAPAEVTRAPLTAHPRAALRRRLTRAVLPAAVVVAAVWTVDARAGLVALTLLPAAALLAVDRYRGLGHARTAHHLVTRTSGLRRRTVALQDSGVIGWTFRQTVLQRRSGLVTAEAVTAAGRGGYPVLDADSADAVALADATTPGLLTPFRPPSAPTITGSDDELIVRPVIEPERPPYGPEDQHIRVRADHPAGEAPESGLIPPG